MAEMTTIARPYAQAVFGLAEDTGDLAVWSDVLQALSMVAGDSQVQALIGNPRVKQDDIVKLFVDAVGGEIDNQAENLVRLLVENDRASALPQIADIYEKLRAEAESTIDAELETALAVEVDQQEKLESALQKKLGRTVNLTCKTNEALIGGAILRAGDWVVDGSVRAQLQRLTGAVNA